MSRDYWPSERIAALIAAGREGDTWQAIAGRFGAHQRAAQSMWSRHASADDIAVRRRSLDRPERHIESETLPAPERDVFSGRCFTDDPRAVRPEYGRLRQ